MSATSKPLRGHCQTALLLCGGKSSRFGGDKLTAQFNGKSLLHIAVATLAGRFDQILIAGSDEVFKQCKPMDKEVNFDQIKDLETYEGPLSAIIPGLQRCNSGGLFVLAADMPLVNCSLIDRILNNVTNETRSVIPCHNDQIHPLCGWYSTALTPEFEAQFKHGIRSVIDVLKDLEGLKRLNIKHTDPDLQCLQNINKPQDLEAIS